MIIVWAPTTSPHASTYGSDLAPEDMQYEREYWKPRTTFRCTTMQVYDLAWSPTGEYIIAGSTDNCARIFTASEGERRPSVGRGVNRMATDTDAQESACTKSPNTTTTCRASHGIR